MIVTKSWIENNYNKYNNLYFGGVGQSGMGGYHGHYSFETFSHMYFVF